MLKGQNISCRSSVKMMKKHYAFKFIMNQYYCI